jgi:ketosteroid isomerase-like protein
MAEESTTPDPVELARRAYEATSRHDIDALMRFYAPNTVWDGSNVGIGTFEGVAAIRSFVEEWWGTWGEHTIEVEEIVDLDHGVVLSSLREDGRLVGSDGHVEQQRAAVVVWVKGIIERQTTYLDIDEARAAAERLAEERADV